MMLETHFFIFGPENGLLEQRSSTFLWSSLLLLVIFIALCAGFVLKAYRLGLKHGYKEGIKHELLAGEKFRDKITEAHIEWED